MRGMLTTAVLAAAAVVLGAGPAAADCRHASGFTVTAVRYAAPARGFAAGTGSCNGYAAAPAADGAAAADNVFVEVRPATYARTVTFFRSAAYDYGEFRAFRGRAYGGFGGFGGRFDNDRRGARAEPGTGVVGVARGAVRTVGNVLRAFVGR